MSSSGSLVRHERLRLLVRLRLLTPLQRQLQMKLDDSDRLRH